MVSLGEIFSYDAAQITGGGASSGILFGIILLGAMIYLLYKTNCPASWSFPAIIFLLAALSTLDNIFAILGYISLAIIGAMFVMGMLRRVNG